MSYFKRGGLKRNLESATKLFSFLPLVNFGPTIQVNFLRYENSGFYDNRCLTFSVFVYFPAIKRRKFSHIVFIPLCLLLNFIEAIEKYDGGKTEKELGFIQEFSGCAKRLIIKQQKDKSLGLISQIRRGNIWDNRDGVKIAESQIPNLKNLLENFSSSHRKEILASCLRNRLKQKSWTSQPPR